MVIAPDEEWSVTWTKSDTSIYNEDNWENIDPITGNPFYISDTMIILWTYHDRVTNWGLLEKDQFGDLEDLFK